MTAPNLHNSATDQHARGAAENPRVAAQSLLPDDRKLEFYRWSSRDQLRFLAGARALTAWATIQRDEGEQSEAAKVSLLHKQVGVLLERAGLPLPGYATIESWRTTELNPESSGWTGLRDTRYRGEAKAASFAKFYAIFDRLRAASPDASIRSVYRAACVEFGPRDDVAVPSYTTIRNRVNYGIGVKR